MNLIMEQKGQRWQGVRILELEEFPPALRDAKSLADSLMRVYAAGRLHAELIIMKRDESDRLYTLLILRWSGVRKDEMEQRMRTESEILLKQLDSAEIKGSFIENTPQGKANLTLLRCFTEQENIVGDVFAMAFYPREEKKTGYPDVYMPGSWIRASGSSLSGLTGTGYVNSPDWNEVLKILTGYKTFLFSLQIVPTVLLSNEEKAIRGSMARIGRMKSENQRGEENRYARLLQAKNQPLYLANLWVRGEKNMMYDLRLYLQSRGLDAVPIPEKLFRNKGYVMNGDWILAQFLNVSAHRNDYQGPVLVPSLRRLTRLATGEELRTAFLPPARPDSIRGLKIRNLETMPETLPDEMLSGEEGILIGCQERTNLNVFLPVRDITRHGCIVGKPGSGKTTFALGFLYRLYKREKPIPFLAVEPSKREYRTLMQCIPELNVYTPGNRKVSPLELNLFMPPKGVTLEEYLPCVHQIFDMTFSMTTFLREVFVKVIRRCYDHYGWGDDSTADSKGVRPFGLHEFIREFRDYVRKNIYDTESRNNVENSGVMRLQQLLSGDYMMFDTIHSPDYEKMLSKPTVIELDAIRDPTRKSLVLAILMVNLMLLITRRADQTEKIRNVILVDEAHVILDPEEKQRDNDAAEPGRAGLKLMQEMTRIFRAYGTALFFGDQSPAKLTKEILGNAEMKLMFRLDDPDDRSILGQTALMDAGMQKRMVSLRAGQGYLSCSRVSKPILLQTPDTEKELGLSKNVPDDSVAERMNIILRAPYSLCESCEPCRGICDLNTRKNARHLAGLLMLNSKRIGEMLSAEAEKAAEMQSALPVYLKQSFAWEAKEAARKDEMEWTNRLKICTGIQLIRELLLDGRCVLSEEELTRGIPDGNGMNNGERRASCYLREFRK